MYYLCGLFALFGAGSPEQFRLSYYLFEAVVWSLLYMRHSGLFGKKKMAVLAALECIITPVLFSTGEGRMILSDNMQGLCTVVLVLELLRYLKLKKIGWDNSIIISLAI
jgi:4-amino-4-deoxy-L-arabinose transferase-like glycosyltransferase